MNALSQAIDNIWAPRASTDYGVFPTGERVFINDWQTTVASMDFRELDDLRGRDENDTDAVYQLTEIFRTWMRDAGVLQGLEDPFQDMTEAFE